MKIPHFAGRKFPTPEDHEWASLASDAVEPSAAFWRVLGATEAEARKEFGNRQVQGQDAGGAGSAADYEVIRLSRLRLVDNLPRFVEVLQCKCVEEFIGSICIASLGAGSTPESDSLPAVASEQEFANGPLLVIVGT